MEEMRIKDSSTYDFFRNVFKDENLVPILGSGFSCGMSTRNRKEVPSGTQLKKDMIDILCRERKDFTKDILAELSFSWIAERFFKCDEEIINKYFYESFTGVRFKGENKKRFLNEIKWPYIYTLNIDTAIESSGDNWEVFFPNNNFVDKSVYDKKKLYKIHGDVNQYLKTKNIDAFIFSESQYIKSIDTNKMFHNMLSTDCISKNLLYIGCSLDDEIDIKYTVISDKNKNESEVSARRIYVTTEDIESDVVKKENLKSFNITHYIKLEKKEDYELFYEFLVQCYADGKKQSKQPITHYEVKKIKMLSEDRKLNLDYLLDFTRSDTLIKPYYFVEKKKFKINDLDSEKINIVIGRRFSGKTMFAYYILDCFQDRKRYYISSRETISDKNLLSLVREKNSLIVIDSNVITENQMKLIRKNKVPNIICIIMNSFDDIANIPLPDRYFKEIDMDFKGRLEQDEYKKINGKLSKLGILIFNEKYTILDNTLRIANKLERNYLDKYEITNEKELELFIWIAVHKKMYLQEMVILGLYKSHREIVKKFSPILELEFTHKGEKDEHSRFKIICNAPLALLQILNKYTYPVQTPMGNTMKNIHRKTICDAIYHILFSYDENGEKAKKFLMFDTLNDIFSRQYTKENIERLESTKKNTGSAYGAVSVIRAVYDDENIAKLKSDEPNYWLQKAKSIYIYNSGEKGNKERIKEGIEWAKMAEGNSETLVSNGKNKYLRTISNAIVQTAMLYGNLANKLSYSDKKINTRSINYYYKALSDANNLTATKSLIAESRGTKDFNELLNYIKSNKEAFDSSVAEEAGYLCSVQDSGNNFIYKFEYNKSHNI